VIDNAGCTSPVLKLIEAGLVVCDINHADRNDICIIHSFYAVYPNAANHARDIPH